MKIRGLRALASVVLISLSVCACRSDGGVGRRDALRSMRWTLDSLEAQHARDVDHTAENLDRLGSWVVDETTDPLHEIQRTMLLYLEGHIER